MAGQFRERSSTMVRMDGHKVHTTLSVLGNHNALGVPEGTLLLALLFLRY